MRLLTRNGYDWTDRYPWIVESALKNRQKQFVIDGDAVVLGVDGVSEFDAMHSGKQNHQVQLYAFDMLAGDGDDVRGLPLSMRKTNLARLLRGRPDGIFIAPFEHGSRLSRRPLAELDQVEEPEASRDDAGQGRPFA